MNKQKTILLLLCAALAGYIYFDGISVLVKQWLRMKEYWRFLVIPVSVYFVWIKRKELTALPIKPGLLWGILFTVAGSIAYLTWKISFVDLSIETGLFILSFGLIFLFHGTSFAKSCFFPLFYLVFMTTILVKILAPLSIFMQQVSAIFASFFLNTAGWQATRSGLFLRLPNLILEVAPACSGISQLIALIAFALPIGMLRHKSLWPRVILVFMTIPITLFSNAVRIVLIAIWNYKGVQTYTHGPHGILDLPLIYPLALVCLYACSLIISIFEKKTIPPAIKNPNTRHSAALPVQILPAWYTGFFLMAITIAAMFILKARPAKFIYSLNDFPINMNEWTGKEHSDNIISFYMGKPDGIIQRKYYNKDGIDVTLAIARFNEQNTHKRITSFTSALFNGNTEPIEIAIDSSTTIKATVYKSIIKNQRLITISWFDVDGVSCRNINSARKQIIANTIKKKHNNAALISITGNKSSNFAADEATITFAKAAFTYVKQCLETAP